MAQWFTILLVSTILQSACTAPAPAVDLAVAANGCKPVSISLPPAHEPALTIRNTASEAMVVSIPAMDRWIELAPGASGVLELPRYIMGTFDLFCLSAADHRTLGGDNPLLCVLEPAELVPAARSAGVLVIEPHDRIREVIEQGR
ncbi:hypothetical protein A6A03_17805 [Chloroflexus islandicus]|uniref:EfeO-type cupredoxin-like domain-containing protein n=1 Tax=Chloroflexus islandicus TaxID=1707952 RepID=A0A178M705_9CHLR|nr:hypothetical protein A6A03_17805 [Chloroflexus islandicus]